MPRTLRPILCLTCALSLTAHADVIFVDADAPAGGNGTTWMRALHSLTDALALASPGDQIWVAQGEYVPESPAGQSATFDVPDRVQLYGGFEGVETSLDERTATPFRVPTVLSGELGPSDLVHSIITLRSVGPETVIDGFLIGPARADGTDSPGQEGAGIYATDSAPTLRNLVISQCVALDGGAAISLLGTTTGVASISGCKFYDNMVTGPGQGGAVDAQIAVNISACTFEDNAALFQGGALALSGRGASSVTDSIFRDNETFAAAADGGAIVVSLDPGESSFSTIERCTFEDNLSVRAGAIYYTFDEASHTIRSCRFLDNSAALSTGGAVLATNPGIGFDLLIENSFFTGNSASTRAGAVDIDTGGFVSIVNSTFARNTVSASGGACVHLTDGNASIENSILWDNTPSSLENDSTGNLTVNRSIVEGLASVSPAPSGTGAFDTNPMFVNVLGPDLIPGTPDDDPRLQPGSPAIDAGNSAAGSGLLTLDLLGQPRYLDDTGTPDTGFGIGTIPVVDMGAAEFQGTTPGASCNEADLAEPFGQLDFTDVIAFLSAFGAMDPAADLATPFGAWDFTDVLAFLGAYGAGCP